jgi:hypothetical protein
MRQARTGAALAAAALVAVIVLVFLHFNGGGSNNASANNSPSTSPSLTLAATSPSPSPSPSTLVKRGGRYGRPAGRTVSIDVDGDGKTDTVTIAKVTATHWKLTAKLATKTCSGTISGLPETIPVLYGGYRPKGLDRDLVIASSNSLDDQLRVAMWELGPTCKWTKISSSPHDISFGRTITAAWTTQCTPSDLIVTTSVWTNKKLTRARATRLHLTLAGTKWKVTKSAHFIQSGPSTKKLGSMDCGGYSWQG